jgi:gamma-glutamylcyclotransferase (GGCT)/AIG2-like uncharacterized protein YtfP
MSDCLFAYGTLQPGRVPAEVAPLAAKLRPVGRGFVHGVLYDLGRYPGAVPNASAKGKIAGTVMELPEEENMLARLDAYEGFDPKSPDTSEYVRERQPGAAERAHRQGRRVAKMGELSKPKLSHPTGSPQEMSSPSPASNRLKPLKTRSKNSAPSLQSISFGALHLS